MKTENVHEFCFPLLFQTVILWLTLFYSLNSRSYQVPGTLLLLVVERRCPCITNNTIQYQVQ